MGGWTMRYAALLRGINIGGRRIKMEDLRYVLASNGFANPQTLLQSGNCVFDTDLKKGNEIEETLESICEAAFGFKVPFYVRSRSELESALDHNPFPEMAHKDPSHLVLHFFKTVPEEAQIAEIKWPGPEELSLKGEVLYISCPNGIGTSELFKDRRISKILKTATARNWTTVQKLHAMTED